MHLYDEARRGWDALRGWIDTRYWPIRYFLVFLLYRTLKEPAPVYVTAIPYGTKPRMVLSLMMDGVGGHEEVIVVRVSPATGSFTVAPGRRVQ